MDAIIWTKDRGCQLQLLLKSIEKNYRVFNKIFITYMSGNSEFEAGYNKLISSPIDLPIIWEKRTEIKPNTISFLNKCDELVCPFVDDDIFYRKCNIQEVEILECLNTINGSVFSFRLGMNIKVSDNFTNQSIEQPNFQGLMYENKEWGLLWKKLPGHTPFGYPISLDGHVFKKEWFLRRCQEIEFSTPNFLEGNLQKFNDDFSLMVSPIESVLTSIPSNRVQEEFTNRTIGEITPEELNQRWLDGEEIDLEEIEKFKVNCTHSNISYKFNQGKS